ncbi:hypothetical protein BN903_199 [Halorubrum sp. AJ67]|nr:hypothetical protein BN903_199 [Halorubrum sp. AJ67]
MFGPLQRIRNGFLGWVSNGDVVGDTGLDRLTCDGFASVRCPHYQRKYRRCVANLVDEIDTGSFGETVVGNDTVDSGLLECLLRGCSCRD